MEVTVIQIGRTLEEAIEVQVENKFGIIWTVWHGTPPIISRKYHIEIGINEKIIWNENLFPTEIINPHIVQENDSIKIYGKLIKVENDGVGIVQIGNNNIFIETDLFKDKANLFVCIVLSELNIYDTNV